MSPYKRYFLVLIAALVFTGSLAPAKEISFVNRDSIEKHLPQPLEKTRPLWEETKSAYLETLAQWLELYSDRDLYFLQSTSLIYDMAFLLGAQDPDLQKRIHLVALSPLNTTSPKNLREYLAQEGLNLQSLKEGKKFIFLGIEVEEDPVEAILPLFDTRYHPQIESRFVTESKGLRPANLSYIASLSADSLNSENTQNWNHFISETEQERPQEYPRSHRILFNKAKNRWETKIPEIADSKSNIGEARLLRSDLHAFIMGVEENTIPKKDILERFQKRRELWKILREKTESHDVQSLIDTLSSLRMASVETNPFLRAIEIDYLNWVKAQHPSLYTKLHANGFSIPDVWIYTPSLGDSPPQPFSCSRFLSSLYMKLRGLLK